MYCLQKAITSTMAKSTLTYQYNDSNKGVVRQVRAQTNYFCHQTYIQYCPKLFTNSNHIFSFLLDSLN